MRFVRTKVAAGIFFLPLLLWCAAARAQSLPDITPDTAPPPARGEIDTELSDGEKAALAQLRSTIDGSAEAGLFNLLDLLPVGARGAFVSTLLDQGPSQRSNILGFLVRLNDKRRVAIAGQLQEQEYYDQRQWTNFFRYVGSVSPDESSRNIFDEVAPSPSLPGTDINASEWIWAEPKDGSDQTWNACGAAFDPAKCVWEFHPLAPGITMGDFAEDAPWQVELYMSDKAGAPYTPREAAEEYKTYGKKLSDIQRQHSCGGILIPGNWVLTAAHCIWDDDRFGRFIDERRARTGTLSLDGGGTTWRITSVVRHAGYNGPKKNDIALLKIAPDKETKLANNRGARPIALPVGTKSSVPDGATLIVTGWGATGRTRIGTLAMQKAGKAPSDYLLQTNVKKVPMARCNDNQNYKQARFKIQDGQVCALGDNGSDSCQGDSGGPLIYHGKRGPTLVGIVSFGPGCGIEGTPGTYTDVAYYRGWISGAMKQARPNQELVWQEGVPAKPLQ